MCRVGSVSKKARIEFRSIADRKNSAIQNIQLFNSLFSWDSNLKGVSRGTSATEAIKRRYYETLAYE